jgi:DivIVA domain-containing protein
MTASPQEQSTHRSFGALRTATFTQRRRGYDESEVRDFLNAVADDVQAADRERAALRAELDRLRDELGPDAQARREEITAHAVSLLSEAQQVADRLVAEAEQYARDLVVTARDQQREILQRARETAGQAERQLAASTPDAAVSSPDIEYVRTFAHVAQHQLRSVLDALAEQVDKLGQFPQPPESEGRPQPTQRRTDALWSPQAVPPPPPPPPLARPADAS